MGGYFGLVELVLEFERFVIDSIFKLILSFAHTTTPMWTCLPAPPPSQRTLRWVRCKKGMHDFNLGASEEPLGRLRHNNSAKLQHLSLAYLGFSAPSPGLQPSSLVQV